MKVCDHLNVRAIFTTPVEFPSRLSSLSNGDDLVSPSTTASDLYAQIALSAGSRIRGAE